VPCGKPHGGITAPQRDPGGGSIGTALLNILAAGAIAQYLAAHLGQRALAGGRPGPDLAGLALVHGCHIAFWPAAAIFASGAVLAGLLLRRGRHRGGARSRGAAGRRLTRAPAGSAAHRSAEYRNRADVTVILAKR
jgi:hypothetical protein